MLERFDKFFKTDEQKAGREIDARFEKQMIMVFSKASGSVFTVMEKPVGRDGCHRLDLFDVIGDRLLTESAPNCFAAYARAATRTDFRCGVFHDFAEN